MIYRLIFLNGPRHRELVTVPETPMIIGRAADCALCLDDPEIAQRHAVLERTPRGLRIRDLGSMGKVLVNQREERDAYLRHGDTVEVGRTRFLLQAVVEAEVHSGLGQAAMLGRRRGRAVAWGGGALVIGALLIVSVRAWLVGREPQPAAHLMPQWDEHGRELIGMPAPRESPPAIIAAVTEGLPTAEAEESNVAHQVAIESPAGVDGDAIAASGSPQVVSGSLVQATVATHTDAVATAAGATAESSDPYRLATAVLRRKIESMMMDVDLLMASNRLVEADELLAGIVRIAPDFERARVERAWLFEERAMLGPAMEQWREVSALATSSNVAEHARRRLAQLGNAREHIVEKFGGHVRVVAAEQKKFPETAEAQEMRILTVQLRPMGVGFGVDESGVRVEIDFYDRNEQSGKVLPTRARVRTVGLTGDGTWHDADLRTVTATYVVPRQAQPVGRRAEQYYGHVVRVYYYDALQDIYARPESLVTASGRGASQGS